MKKFIMTVMAFLLIAFSAAAQRDLGKNLYNTPSLMLIPPAGCGLLIYYDCKTEMFGFLLNSSSLHVVIEAQFDNIYNEPANQCDYMIKVCKNGKWGFVDTNFSRTFFNEQPIVPCIYDEVSSFRNGKAKVTKDGETFYINVSGKRI